jgi:hypothetical protein
MTDLYVVGVHHKYQFGPCHAFKENLFSAHEAFAVFLKNHCVQLSIKTLAEEINFDARKKWGIKQTVPKRIAEDLCIEHAECDPNEEERKQLGILNEGFVKMNGLINEWSAETVQANIRREYDKREAEWIHRLSQLNHFPVLFVCGSKHSKSFLEKANKHGFNAQLIVEEWTPNKVPKACGLPRRLQLRTFEAKKTYYGAKEPKRK